MLKKSVMLGCGRYMHLAHLCDNPGQIEQAVPDFAQCPMPISPTSTPSSRLPVPAASAAAATLRGVSPSSLSEALRRLEGGLGVRLLNRTTRSVTPTEAGERLLERLVPALGEVGAALDAVNLFRDSPAGTLRLNVATVVARVVLPPLVTRFLRTAPRHRAGGDGRRQLHRRAGGRLRRRRAL